MRRCDAHGPHDRTLLFCNMWHLGNTGKYHGADYPYCPTVFGAGTSAFNGLSFGPICNVTQPSPTARMREPHAAFNPLDAVRACVRWWPLSLAILVTTVVLSLLMAAQIKPKYESEASLFVRLGRESAGLDPTATTTEITPIYETREQELNSALEVMQSRKLLEAVLSVVGEQAVLNPAMFDVQQWRQKLATTEWPELDPERLHHSDPQRERAIAALHRAIDLETSQSSSVMGLSSVAGSPQLAQAITRTMLDAFRTEHVRLNRTHGLAFFSEQVRMLQAQLDTARAAVTSRKNHLGVMSIDGERARLEDELTALEKQLHTELSDLSGARASVAVYERAVRDLPERTQPHDAADTLRKKLYELQQQRRKLLSTFNDNHFRVRDADAEIELLRQQMQDPANRNAANPTLRELEVSLAGERAKVAQLQASLEELRRSQRQLRDQLTRLNNAEADMSRLLDRVAEIQAAKVKATVKQEEARVLDELSAERISNIQVVQPPTFNPVSQSPARSLVVVGGIIVGLAAALVIPAVLEFVLWYVRLFAAPPQEESEGALVCG